MRATLSVASRSAESCSRAVARRGCAKNRTAPEQHDADDARCGDSAAPYSGSLVSVGSVAGGTSPSSDAPDDLYPFVPILRET
jgi:hypothetical protein